MKKFSQLCFLVLFLGIGLMILMPSANAQEKKAENAPDYKLIKTAMDMADYGYDKRDAVALANAAKIFVDNPVKSANAKNVETKKPVVCPGAHDYSPEALLAEAKRVAGNNKTELDYIKEVEKFIAEKPKEKTRSTAKSAAVYQDIYISGGSTEFFYVDIPSMSYVTVDITGSDANLCLYVYNEISELKDSDCRRNPSTGAGFLFSQEIKIKLVNKSNYGTSCRIILDGVTL